MRLDRRVARMLVSLASVAVAALVVAGASPRALAQTAPAADLAVTGYSDRHVSLSWTDTSGGLSIDRNVPEMLRIAARKKIVLAEK